MKLIVGLGNIGDEYAKTIHNAGFMVLDKVAEQFNLKFNKRGCDADFAEKNINGELCIFAKPRTFMNESGKSVKSFVKKYDVSLNSILVVSDDIDLPVGSVRVRKFGSAGTHNGLKSVVGELSSTDFARVRVGVGKPDEHQDLANFVLSKMKFSPKQESGIEKAAQAVVYFVQGENIEKIMNRSNGESETNKH